MANMNISGAINFGSLDASALGVLRDLFFPVGSLFISNTDENPASKIGGNWQRVYGNATLPLGSNAPVVGNGMTIGVTNGSYNGGLFTTGSIVYLMAKTSYYGSGTGTGAEGTANTLIGQTIGLTGDPNRSGMVAQLGSSGSRLDGLYFYIRLADDAV